MAKSIRYANFISFTVEGSGEFPIDMLRYDACYPATEQDSYGTLYNGDGLRRIRLKHRVLKDENLANVPCLGRWRSFTWKVVEGSVEYDR